MIHHGDLFDVLPSLEDDSIDAGVTDPPYGIGFMGKEWDTFKPAKTDAEIKRKIQKSFRVDHGDSASRHDGYDQNPNTRGRKRSPAMSPSQIEYDRTLRGQRGFQEWTRRWASEMYRVLKPGAYLLVCGAPRSFHRMTCGLEDGGFEIRDCLSWLFGQGFPKSLNLGEGRGTALKPSWEPIVVARKPFKGSVTANVATHGTGALNIDACRLGYVSDADKASAFPGGKVTSHGSGSLAGPGAAQHVSRTEFDAVQSDIGRWPPNVAIDDVISELVDEQSGELSTGEWPSSRQAHKFGRVYESAFPGAQNELSQRTANAGGASRFFYCAKPSREERDLGCEGLILKPRDESRKAGNPGGDNPRNRGLQLRGNFHPTVKPVALMRWLVRLVTPPGGVVLDPFTGSGTTGIGCKFELREFVGIEREAEFVEIANRRIAAAVPLLGQMLESAAAEDDGTQAGLFSDD